MRKAFFLCLTILLAGVLFAAGCSLRTASAPPAGETPPPEPTPSPVPTPIPYDILLQNAPVQYSFLEDAGELGACMDALAANAAKRETETDSESLSLASARLSGGEAQGDLMARSGDTLYLLAEKDLVILRLDGEASRVLSRTKIGTDWTGQEGTGLLSGGEDIPTGLYCGENVLAVTLDCYGYEGGSGELTYTEYTGLKIFDVSDPASPRLLTSYGQDGSFRAAALEGNTLLLATEYEVFPQEGEGDLIPALYYNGEASPLEARNICFARDGWFSGYSLVGAYDLSEPRRIDVKALLGVGGEALAGSGEIYYHSARRAEVQGRTFEGFSENAQISCTDVFRLALGENGLTVAAAAVNGTLPESGGMDARDGVLRLLTSLSQRLYPVTGAGMPFAVEEETGGTAVCLLDDTLTQIGKTELDADMADIRWAGFLPDRVIVSLSDGESSIPVDVSQPAAPALGEALPEYVTALAVFPWGEEGWAAFSQEEAGELTLTVYDGGFRALSRRSFGSDHSSTLENVRGYMWDAGENVIGFPADDSYCVYGFTPGEGIVFRGDAFLRDWAWNARGFIQGEYFYVADRLELCVSPKEDLTAFLSIPY